MRKKRIGCLLAVMGLIGMMCVTTVQAGTPEIIIDGVVVQESQTPAILEACEKFQAQLQADIAAGNLWTYHNGGKTCDEWWNNAVAYGKRGCNCALLARWAAREAGLLGPGDGGFYGKKGGTIAWSGNAEAVMKKTCDIIYIGGTKTVNELLAGDYLKPGDILTYVTVNHTNIYAGNGMWYDGGHAYCKGSGTGAVFTSWYGGTVHGASPVGYIIRPKETEDPIVIRDITPDIVIRDITSETDMMESEMETEAEMDDEPVI